MVLYSDILCVLKLFFIRFYFCLEIDGVFCWILAVLVNLQWWKRLCSDLAIMNFD